MTEVTMHEVTRDGGRDLRFSGHLVAETHSRTTSGPGQNRWTEIRVYETVSGNRVVETVGRTCWQGETDRHAAVVVQTDEELIHAVEQDYGDGPYLGRLGKEILGDIGVDYCEEIG